MCVMWWWVLGRSEGDIAGHYLDSPASRYMLSNSAVLISSRALTFQLFSFCKKKKIPSQPSLEHSRPQDNNMNKPDDTPCEFKIPAADATSLPTPETTDSHPRLQPPNPWVQHPAPLAP